MLLAEQLNNLNAKLSWIPIWVVERIDHPSLTFEQFLINHKIIKINKL